MEKKVNTRQNYLWAIKNVLELQSEPNKEVLSMIQNLIDSGKKEIDSYYQEQKKTKRESDNWISLKKLQEFNKNQKKALMTTTNKFTKTPNKKELKNWLITSLYTLDPENHPPMRIDYNMEIIKSRDEINRVAQKFKKDRAERHALKNKMIINSYANNDRCFARDSDNKYGPWLYHAVAIIA